MNFKQSAGSHYVYEISALEIIKSKKLPFFWGGWVGISYLHITEASGYLMDQNKNMCEM